MVNKNVQFKFFFKTKYPSVSYIKRSKRLQHTKYFFPKPILCKTMAMEIPKIFNHDILMCYSYENIPKLCRISKWCACIVAKWWPCIIPKFWQYRTQWHSSPLSYMQRRGILFLKPFCFSANLWCKKTSFFSTQKFIYLTSFPINLALSSHLLGMHLIIFNHFPPPSIRYMHLVGWMTCSIWVW